MASKENQPDFNTALEKLKICLKGKNLDGKYPEVKEFLVRLDQAVAEKNADLVQTACNDFLREDRLKRINGISGTAIEELKKEVNNFVEKIGKSTNTQTSGAKISSKPGDFSQTVAVSKSQGEKLNIPVQSATVGPHKTTVSHPHPKPDHRDTQGPSPKAPRKDNFVREAKENKNNDAAPKEEPIGLPNENAEKGQIDWKHKANCLEKTLEDKTKIIAKFEKEAEKMYQENLSLEQVNQNLVKDQEKLKRKNDDLLTELQTKTEEWNLCLEQYEETCKAADHYKKKVTHLEDSIKSINRQNEERIQKLVAERDDLRNRYSKVAGQKLKDNNSDISDLSDPFRPMKLGEKFSELYDNEWTDAFSSLTDKMKMNEKDAIKLLLDTLEECYRFCKEVADRQFTQLRDVFLYHGQDVTKTVAPTDKPRLHSKQESSLLEVRKAIASTKPESVVKLFLEKMKGKPDEKCPKEITAYYEKCAETCWLLAVHNPPLYMDMEMKPGTKLDINLYTPYYTPGDKTDFLVWPPLFNVKNGGLINKGVMAPVMEKRKKGK